MEECPSPTSGFQPTLCWPPALNPTGSSSLAVGSAPPGARLPGKTRIGPFWPRTTAGFFLAGGAGRDGTTTLKKQSRSPRDEKKPPASLWMMQESHQMSISCSERRADRGARRHPAPRSASPVRVASPHTAAARPRRSRGPPARRHRSSDRASCAVRRRLSRSSSAGWRYRFGMRSLATAARPRKRPR